MTMTSARSNANSFFIVLPSYLLCILDGTYQQMPNGIITYFSQERGAFAVLCQSSQEIGRSAARQSLHRRIAVWVGTAGSKIYQQFSQSNYINHRFFLLVTPSEPGFLYFYITVPFSKVFVKPIATKNYNRLDKASFPNRV